MSEADPFLADSMSASGVREPGAARGLWSPFVAYTLVNTINAAIPVLLVPVLTRYLTPKDYGTLVVFDMVLGFLNPLVGLGTASALRRRFFDRDIDYRAYLGSTIAIHVGALVPWCIAIALAGDVLAGLLRFPVGWLWALVPIVAGSLTIGQCLTLLQLDGRVTSYGVLQGLNTLANLTLSVVLVAVFGYDWQGRILAQVFTAVGVGAVALCLIVARHRPRWPKAVYVRDGLAFGAPTVPMTLTDRTIAFADRAMVVALVGLDAAGVYALGYQIAGLLGLLTQSFGLAFQPWVFARLSQRSTDADRGVVRATYAAIGGLCASGASLYVLAPVFLPYVAGRQFHGAIVYLPWLVGGFVLRGTAAMFATVVLHSGRTASLAIVTVPVLGLNLLLNAWFIDAWGAIGAARASCAAGAVNVLLLAAAAQRLYPLPWLLRRDGPDDPRTTGVR